MRKTAKLGKNSTQNGKKNRQKSFEIGIKSTKPTNISKYIWNLPCSRNLGLYSVFVPLFSKFSKTSRFFRKCWAILCKNPTQSPCSLLSLRILILSNVDSIRRSPKLSDRIRRKFILFVNLVANFCWPNDKGHSIWT